jgi:signal transduction histidine kinase
LFAAGSLTVMLVDDADEDIAAGDSYESEVGEMFLAAVPIAFPLAIAAAVLTAVLAARRMARPIDDAIRAARETSARDLKRTLPVPERDDELRDLVVSLNELFVRLDDGFGALGRFAADASHELRTPLAVIATGLEVALRHPRPSSEWEAIAGTSLDELRRLSNVVEGLLALARADADTPAAHQPVRVVECVDAVVAQLAAAAEHRGIALLGPSEAIAARVLGNAVTLETAIRNLVVNAIAATPRGGEIRVGIESAANRVVVTVDDSGPGLGDDPDRLFAPFTRGAGTANGVGLGLTIARRIAVAHGGAVRGDRSALGGARLSLSVPSI